MLFRICNTGGRWNDSIVDKYPILRKFGYHNEHEYKWYGKAGWIVINSLEELLRLCKKVKAEIIIDVEEDTPVLEIYDDYRE